MENNRVKEHKINCGMGIQGKKHKTLPIEYEYMTRKEQNFASGIWVHDKKRTKLCMWNMSTGRQKEKQLCMECENSCKKLP